MLSNSCVTRTVFLFCCIFLFFRSNAQSLTSDRYIKEKSKPFFVSLVPERSDLNRIGIQSVSDFQVLDYRPDSSRLGFFKEKGNEPFEILLKNSSPAEIGNALQTAIAMPNGTRSFVIVLRKLWLSDVISSLQTIAESQSPAARCRISFQADVYLKNKAVFVPLFSFDTLILSRKTARAIAPFETPDLLIYLLNKLKTTDVDKLVSSRRKIGFAELDAFSRKSFLYPADTISIPRKGVYVSLAEFKNNTPSVSDFELRRDKDAPVSVFLKDAEGRQYLTRQIWGVCDGENLFIRMGGNVYPAIRSGHSFYVYGSLVSFVKKITGGKLPSLPVLFSSAPLPGTNKSVSRTSFFAVDMDTGELL